MDLSKFIFQQIMVICNRHNEKFLQCCNDERGSDDSKDIIDAFLSAGADFFEKKPASLKNFKRII